MLAVPRRFPRPVPDGITHAVVVPVGSSIDLPGATWGRDCPAPRGSAEAERIVGAETRRPLEDGQASRAVVVTYPDSDRDLILVGDRDVLDGPALLRYARALASGQNPGPASGTRPTGPDPVVPVTVPGEGVSPFLATNPSGGPDLELRQEWGATTTELLVAAVAVVLGRLGRCSRPTVAAHVTTGAGEGTVLLAPCVDDDVSVTGLLTSVRNTLGDPAMLLPPAARLDPSEARIGIGILDMLEAGPGERAMPALSAPFPLTLAPVRLEDGVEITALARAESGDLPQLEGLLATIRHVHRQIAAGHGDLGDISLVAHPAPEIPEITEMPAGRSLHAAFADVAARRPEEIALSDGERSVTYSELDREASLLAAGLRAAGVLVGERVGICLERSSDLIATMIAVLRAGATYVPMDPAYPDERLSYTSRDAGLRLVVSTRTSFPADGELIVLTPDEVRSWAAQTPDLMAPGTGDPSGQGGQGPAYVIYTSGSTGRPKGVVVAHTSVLALIEGTRADLALSPDDTWTLFHSSAFDFSVWEIWAPLLTGARLVLVPYWATRDPEEFWDLLRRERVTVLNQTPSAFRQLDAVDSTRAQRLALRLVVFGGESLDTRRLTGWFDRYPETVCRLVNMFGITETTVHVTSRTLSRADALTGSSSVGWALPGWSLTVRDRRLRPVPVGFPGEILVGGAGLALEYLGRPELTAERFVEDPLTGRRLYRSGDLGRLGPDGQLDHLGRIDNQVKIRGFRIELDEIAKVLEGAPGVQAAAVVVGGDTAQDTANARLDAYVVPGGLDLQMLRVRAERLLPVHMVPATITPLAALPLTANGKLDIRALPDPYAVRQPSPAPVPVPTIPPAATADVSTDEQAVVPLPERLRALWQDLLGVPVSAHDNFFELGGNSLLAVRLSTLMRENGLPPLNLRLLYLNATPGGLAAAMQGVPVG
ncbi:hypothetical protein GCM10027456_64930 [Kineosporia babensis]